MFYRIAHKTIKYANFIKNIGNFPSGPYFSRERFDKLIGMAEAHRVNTHPNASQDNEAFTQAYVSGFTSSVLLLTWFNSWLNSLHEEGFVVWVYETDKMLLGLSGKQCFAKPTDLKFVKNISIEGFSVND